MTDPDRRERFIREARAASALEHPNIAVIHDVGEDDGVSFIAMELIRGDKLSHRDRQRPVRRQRRPRPRDRDRDRRRPRPRAQPGHRPSRSQARQRDAHRRWSRQGDRLRPRQAAGAAQRRRATPSPRRPPIRRWSSAPCITCRPSRRAAAPSITAPTSSPSACCSTRCSAARCRSAARAASRPFTPSCTQQPPPLHGARRCRRRRRRRPAHRRQVPREGSRRSLPGHEGSGRRPEGGAAPSRHASMPATMPSPRGDRRSVRASLLIGCGCAAPWRCRRRLWVWTSQSHADRRSHRHAPVGGGAAFREQHRQHGDGLAAHRPHRHAGDRSVAVHRRRGIEHRSAGADPARPGQARGSHDRLRDRPGGGTPRPRQARAARQLRQGRRDHSHQRAGCRTRRPAASSRPSASTRRTRPACSRPWTI